MSVLPHHLRGRGRDSRRILSKVTNIAVSPFLYVPILEVRYKTNRPEVWDGRSSVCSSRCRLMSIEKTVPSQRRPKITRTTRHLSRYTTSEIRLRLPVTAEISLQCSVNVPSGRNFPGITPDRSPEIRNRPKEKLTTVDRAQPTSARNKHPPKRHYNYQRPLSHQRAGVGNCSVHLHFTPHGSGRLPLRESCRGHPKPGKLPN